MRNEEETIQESENQMIASILDLDDTAVREVMVPRIDMVVLDVETRLHDTLEVILHAGHSRIPVYEDNSDHIVGVLYAKDLLLCFQNQKTDVPIRNLLREPHFVPGSKKVSELIAEMQLQRVHIALIVDEYGGTAGLVTIEDLLEQIVGEIQDEYDPAEISFVEKIGNHTYVLNSRLYIDKLVELLDIEIDHDNVDTLGGFIYGLAGRVPDQGESIDYERWRFTVLKVDGHRILQIRAEKLFADSVDEVVATGKSSDASKVSSANDPVSGNDSLLFLSTTE